MLRVNPELGQLPSSGHSVPALEPLLGPPEGPAVTVITLLIALKSPWLLGHLQPMWDIYPYLSLISHLRSLSATLQCTRHFCIQSLDSHLSAHEETEARSWCNSLPNGN